MATGSGLGGLLPVAMVVVGVITMLRARSQTRARRRSGEPTIDLDAERRRGEAAEQERRMAAYLAGRDSGQQHRSGP